MPSWKRLTFYILINIIVSALTVLTVLWIWEKTHPAPQILPNSVAATVQVPPGTSLPNTDDLSNTLPPSQSSTLAEDHILVDIDGIFGVGNYELEYVLIHNLSEGSINLFQWHLTNNKGDTFIFPDLTLNKDGAVKLYSKAGINTVIELFWSSQNTLWSSGHIAALLDNDGNVRAIYEIP